MHGWVGGWVFTVGAQMPACLACRACLLCVFVLCGGLAAWLGLAFSGLAWLGLAQRCLTLAWEPSDYVLDRERERGGEKVRAAV